MLPSRRVLGMSFQARLLRLLSKGRPLDGRELVEVCTMPLFARPHIEEALRQHGIASVCTDAFNLVTKSCTDVRVQVARDDLVRARQITADL